MYTRSHCDGLKESVSIVKGEQDSMKDDKDLGKENTRLAKTTDLATVSTTNSDAASGTSEDESSTRVAASSENDEISDFQTGAISGQMSKRNSSNKANRASMDEIS